MTSSNTGIQQGGQVDFKTNIQLSKKTIDILRNFSTINKSILIKTGKWVETMSVNKNIFPFKVGCWII